ncbi:MAG: WD40 repeat domain-containing protein [Microcystaceae cyanobacterium]
MKTLKKRHWLEIAEYLSLIGVLITLITATFTKVWIIPLFLIFVSLLINLLNRWRLESLQRKRLSAMGKQLHQQVLEDIQALPTPSPPSPLPSPVNSLDESALGIVSDSLGSIEQSIKTIIQYLNTHALPERMDRLESLSEQLRSEVAKIIGRDNFTVNSAVSSPTPSENLALESHSSPVSSSPSPPNWQLYRTFRDHEGAVSCLSLIISDRPYLISGSWDQQVKLWDIESETLKMGVIAHSQGLISLAVSHRENQTLLATGSFDQTIKLWSIENLRSEQPELSLKRTLTAHTGSIHDLSILDNLLVSGSYDQTVKQWDLLTGDMIASSLDESGAIYRASIDKSGTFIASGGGDGKICLWKPNNGELLAYLTGNLSSVEAIAISPDSHTLAGGCVDGKIRIWSINLDNLPQSANIQPIQALNAHDGHVKALCFSPDGQFLYSGGADGYVRIWHSSSDIPLQTLKSDDKERQDAILSLFLSQEGSYLATGNSRGVITLWQVGKM